MLKLNLEVPETEQIEINGNIFDINMSDAEIIDRCADLYKKCADLNLKKDGADNTKNIELIKSAANEIVGFIDEILGEGAAVKISGGRPVNIATAYGWLSAVCGAVGSRNEDYIAEKYE